MRNVFLGILIFTGLLTMETPVQAQAKYNYQSQQKLLPTELGVVYMGMNLKAFSQKIKIDSAEVEDRFEELALDIPFEKGNIKKLSVKFTGLTAEQKEALVRTEKVTEKGEYGEYEREVKRISLKALVAAGKLYEIDVSYNEGFDLKKYVTTKYGKPSDVYKQGDQYHIFDMQWTKVSADKLTWLIRYHEKTKVLQLAGLVPGSEWSMN